MTDVDLDRLLAERACARLIAEFAADAAPGQFGPITAAATREFQRAQRRTPDGAVGPRTRAAMERLLGV